MERVVEKSCGLVWHDGCKPGSEEHGRVADSVCRARMAGVGGSSSGHVPEEGSQALATG